MIYRPRAEMRMWDTWMFAEDGCYHLFTLTSPMSVGHWDRVCHAVSRDLIHWEDRPDIALEDKNNEDAWDAGTMLTGSTFKCHRGYGMTYGAVRASDLVQRIGVAFSKDLDVWEKCPENPILIAQGPYYEDSLESTAERAVAWRDACVMPVDGGYEAVIAANDASKPKTVNGCVARATSKDLIEWELHPPMASPGRYIDMEVPQYFEWNGRHYLLFSTGGPIDVPSRRDSLGTYYLVADEKYGEYRAPDDNLLIGSGDFRMDCYVGKVIFGGLGPLLHHHVTYERKALAAPKRLCQGPDGELWLERWEGLAALLGDPILSAASPGTVIRTQGNVAIGQWRVEGGDLVGDGGPAMSGRLFDEAVGDCAIDTRIDLSEASRAGVLFHVAPVEKPRPMVRGLALCVDRGRGVVQLCEAQVETRRAVQLKPLDTVYGRRGPSARVEVFLRAEYVEIYCDGRPLFVLNACDYPTRGKVGSFVDGGSATFGDAWVRAIPEPMGQ